MNLIYTGSYTKRFDQVIAKIKSLAPRSVTELCFGDTLIADFCRKEHIVWKGIDINDKFVSRARRKGYDSVWKDVSRLTSFEPCDLFVMSGSLYHFDAGQRERLFTNMLAVSDRILLSEPVLNLSSRPGIIGKLARSSANAGKGFENFRFSEQTFLEMLEDLGKKLNFSFLQLGFMKKDMIVLLEKNLPGDVR
jgi:hypothetical protein